MECQLSFWQLGDELRGQSMVSEDHKWFMAANKLAEQTRSKSERMNNIGLSKNIAEIRPKENKDGPKFRLTLSIPETLALLDLCEQGSMKQLLLCMFILGCVFTVIESTVIPVVVSSPKRKLVAVYYE
ncbi:hypothetical protein ACHQM5_008727 [Ranunculus cassubicifolius]